MSGDTATAEAEGYARVEDMRQRDMANAQRLAELDLLQVTDTREGANQETMIRGFAQRFGIKKDSRKGQARPPPSKRSKASEFSRPG